MRILFGLLLAPVLAGAQGPVAPETAAESPERVFERIAVIGASASAGFHIGHTLGVDVPLAAVIDRMVAVPHERVVDLSDDMLFLRRSEGGKQQVEQALAHDPTLVVAVDFLFWFSYGGTMSSDIRAEWLEEGFDLLDRFECPVLTSEIPYMPEAVETGMISAFQLPQQDVLDGLNARVREWAASKPNVVLVPMREYVERLKQGEPFESAGVEWGQKDLKRMLQEDRLHPTLDGLTALAWLTMETFRAAQPDLPPEVLHRDPKVLAWKTYLEVEDDPRNVWRPRPESPVGQKTKAPAVEKPDSGS